MTLTFASLTNHLRNLMRKYIVLETFRSIVSPPPEEEDLGGG